MLCFTSEGALEFSGAPLPLKTGPLDGAGDGALGSGGVVAGEVGAGGTACAAADPLYTMSAKIARIDTRPANRLLAILRISKEDISARCNSPLNITQNARSGGFHGLARLSGKVGAETLALLLVAEPSRLY
jgi:hypothetical protein